MAELVAIRTFYYEHEAEFVKGLLEASGIAAEVTGDDCGALDPALGFVRGVRVLVMDDRVSDAEGILESAEQALPSEDQA